MEKSNPGTGSKVAEVLKAYGRCIELVPIDRQFKDITVGLYLKGAVYTVWTFSQIDGARERIEAICGRMVTLGGMKRVPGTRTQLTFACGDMHAQPIKFLLSQAVGKNAEFSPAEGEMRIKDTKSDLWLTAEGFEEQGRYCYRISGEGHAPNPPMRLRMVVKGFVTYGKLEKAGETAVSFACGHRHDELLRLLLPYSRNISAVETMIEEESNRGQMNTGTLGFSPI